jgi:hypothetical protein
MVADLNRSMALLYELRTYHVMPGRMADLNRRFAEITLGYFEKYGITVVGFWQNELGGASDELIYMLAYESLADREQKWTAFARDRERIDAFAETEKDGPLVRTLTAHILRPTAYSPMK